MDRGLIQDALAKRGYAPQSDMVDEINVVVGTERCEFGLLMHSIFFCFAARTATLT